MSFAETLKTGKAGESLIARYFLRKGYNILPVYEKTDNDFKGPTITTPLAGALIAPDLLVFKADKVFWIEAKHKSAFTWHRISNQWVTGVDIHHYQQYLKVQEAQPSWDIWLFFLHREGTAKDTPSGMVSPTGLFANRLEYLHLHENHRHTNWGRHGMVYWSVNALKLIAPLGSILAPAA